MVVERLFVRPITRRSVIAVAIMTIGVDVVLQTEITRRLGIDIVPVGDPWGSATVDVVGITVPQTRVAALLVALILLGGFFAWSKFSDWGIAMRASAEDHRTAELMGVRLSRVSAIVWVIAAVLAVLAGVFLSAFPSPGVSPTSSAAALRAFPAAILGGLDSTAVPSCAACSSSSRTLAQGTRRLSSGGGSPRHAYVVLSASLVPHRPVRHHEGPVRHLRLGTSCWASRSSHPST